MNEAAIRLAAFVVVLGLVMLWELAAPRRPWTVFRPFRWTNNLALLALGAVLVRLTLPMLAAEAAYWAEPRRIGLLNRVYWPLPVKAAIAFLFLDLVIYLQHAAFHHVPPLWRLHKVHHTDVDVDATTGIRFHPLEILISMLIKIAAVMALGAHWLAVIAFEVVLNATSLFNHADARMPATLDAALRLAVVTPDMHRIHHSVAPDETNSNFGFNLTWWDRLFGTYRAEPRGEQARMPLGLPQHRSGARQTLPWLLGLPFSRS